MAGLPERWVLLVFHRSLLWGDRLVDTMDFSNVIDLDFNVQLYYLELYAMQEIKISSLQSITNVLPRLSVEQTFLLTEMF